MKGVISKLKFKDAGVIINAPQLIENEFLQIGFVKSFNSAEKSRNTIVFVNNYKELLDLLTYNLNKTDFDGIFWIAYPKISSGIKTDINRDIIRSTAGNYGISTVTAISVDNTWSALRFRPTEKVGKNK